MRKKIHQIPKPKFKVGEICVLKNINFDLISIHSRKFAKYGYNQWIYYVIPPSYRAMTALVNDKLKRVAYYDYVSKCMYATEENIEKLSDEQKVELL